MSSKRIQKKKAKQESSALDGSIGRSSSLYEIREVVVTVPCPSCAHPTLNRSYLPAAGSMNGTVQCPRCEHAGSYVHVLAAVMAAEDPLPAPVVARVPEIAHRVSLVPPPVVVQRTFRQVLKEVWAVLQQSFVARLGLRKRWRFASI